MVAGGVLLLGAHVPGTATSSVDHVSGAGINLLDSGAGRSEGALSSPGAPVGAAQGSSAKVANPPATSAGASTSAGGSPATSTAGSNAAGCTVSALLVPSCGAWWGVSPSTSGSLATQVSSFERMTGARTDIYHGYHRAGQMFPTREEINIAHDPSGHRLLLLSMKPTVGHNWAQVAAGAEDAYLARLASYIRANYNEKFFMSIHHEPENDVRPQAGSGMTATDYRNMFRHVVQRLKAGGATNVVFVANFQGTQKFHTESWWPQMYPGDDVVDWIGWDSYSCVKPGNGPCNDFAGTMNRRFSQNTPWPGFYNWATRSHPGKPLIVCELGVYETGDSRKADFFRSAITQARSFPAIKAINYWDSGSRRQAALSPGSSATAAAAAFAQSSLFSQRVP